MSELPDDHRPPDRPPARIRLLALDVDGTLLDSTGVVRPRVERAVRAAQLAGCEVVLATGRRLHSVEPIAAKLGIETIILVDGTVVYDRTAGQAVYERTMSAEAQRVAIDLARSAELPPILFESPASSGRVLAPPTEFDNASTRRFLSQRDTIVRMSWNELERAARIVTVIAMGDEAPVAELAARAENEAHYELVVWKPSLAGYHHHTVSFAPRYTSKGAAFGWLAEERGISMSQTMAVGDYDNDVSLVAVAGWGVAMGNAIPSVRRAANALVADNDHDGVAEAIERWVL
jgi:Cof subfamily protein (haloacid dehalogenase superfamily)